MSGLRCGLNKVPVIYHLQQPGVKLRIGRCRVLAQECIHEATHAVVKVNVRLDSSKMHREKRLSGHGGGHGDGRCRPASSSR